MSPKSRGIVFCLILAWIIVPPFLHHALRIRRPYVRDWGMMGNAGVPLREARFYAVQGGTWRKLNWDHLRPPRPQSRNSAGSLKTDEDVLSIARRLCAESRPGADIRVRSRLGRRQGWTPERNGESNVCAQ